MVEILPAEQRDVEAIMVLMEDLDRFYGTIDVAPPDQRVQQITASLFQDPVAAYVMLAWEDGHPVGMAAYSFLWPAAGVTRSLYLKELYVTKTFRCKGIGALLMQRLCQVAVEHECSRIEWTADEGNAPAQVFYEQLGVPKHQEKIFFRLEGNDLRRMASSRTDQR